MGNAFAFVKIQKGRVDSLDRVELGIKLEQMNRLRDKGEFEEASKVADTIEWRKIKRWSELSFAADVYESAGRLKDARNVCVYAYNRNLGGKRLIYRLAELSVKIDDLDEAEELYKEFVEEAPKDTSRFILLYKINIAREAPVDRLIEILEEYKQNELEEQYEYELALLYAQAGRIEECIRECDDLILWFNEGEYVEKALILKSNFVPLTQTQQNKFNEMQRSKAEAATRAAQVEPEVSEDEIIPEYVYDKNEAEQSVQKMREIDADEIKIPIKESSIYDTQNLQAEIAKSMSIILEGMSKGKKTPEDEAILKATGFDIKDEPVIESLENALPETEQSQPEKKVSEPTKEIRVNAHYWNKNTAESDKPSDVNTDVVEKEQDDIKESKDDVEENQDDIVEGQIGIMDWLNSASDTDSVNPLAETANIMEAVSEIVAAFENTTAATVETEPELQTESKPESKPESEPESENDNSEEERMVDELTRKLIEEVQADLMERTVTVVPDEHPEEEYISSDGEITDEYAKDAELTDDDTVNSEIKDNETTATETTDSEISKNTDMDETSQQVNMVKEPLKSIEPEETVEENPEKNKLTDGEKKYIRKYLGIEGMEAALTNTIRGKKNEISDGTSSSGNIVIVGKADTDRAGFAINLFKALHAGENTKQLKIAKTTSAILNKKGIQTSAEKIKGTTLIIENAGTLVPEVVKELTEFMLGQTESMLVIIMGEDYSINKLFREFPTFAALFGYTLELKNMSVNDLVNVAKEYANEKGYAIDEKALLNVYLLIDGLQMTSPGAEIEEVKKLVDEAIERCDNGSKWPFGRKSKGLILLKEKHFS